MRIAPILWSLFLSGVAFSVAFSGTLKILKPDVMAGNSRLGSAVWRAAGLLEVLAGLAIVTLPPLTAGYLVTGMFVLYAGAYAILVRTMGVCPCFGDRGPRRPAGSIRILPGVMRRIITATIPIALATLLGTDGLPGGSSPLLVMIPILGVALAVALQRTPRQVPVSGSDESSRVAIDDTQVVSRRRIIQGAVGLVTILATGLSLELPAYAEDCAQLTLICIGCCDEICPHAECYDDCTTCHNRCTSGQPGCFHSYGCWFGD